ncbi:DUF423 domain-containing protein [Plesiomonas shigelloides]|uniref:DUF423 domain-containing protein n=1 Tax=Plesiomonas shigelloides TaxID=703 RepID=UPI002247F197|nr:DUF423 domain-containing protein [Plesiomonas shigelloides]MCX2532294.1 DUF423 domain-containing protein [Plesiomonas shigelloides]
MMLRFILPFGALSGFFVVAFGAFGAHVLSRSLAAAQMTLLQTGLNYQMFHTAALLAVGVFGLQYPRQRLDLGCLWWVLGILLFSGSLYAYALSGLHWLVWLTPVGGVSFLAGWLVLLSKLLQLRRTAHE